MNFEKSKMSIIRESLRISEPEVTNCRSMRIELECAFANLKMFFLTILTITNLLLLVLVKIENRQLILKKLKSCPH